MPSLRGLRSCALVVQRFEIACVTCDAALILCKAMPPQIDACGFERYDFECSECRSRLTGIIDPYDEALLLSTGEVIAHAG
jgi:hypothetical protein